MQMRRQMYREIKSIREWEGWEKILNKNFKCLLIDGWLGYSDRQPVAAKDSSPMSSQLIVTRRDIRLSRERLWRQKPSLRVQHPSRYVWESPSIPHPSVDGKCNVSTWKSFPTFHHFSFRSRIMFSFKTIKSFYFSFNKKKPNAMKQKINRNVYFLNFSKLD